MPVCPHCGSQQPEGNAFCDACGASLSRLHAPAEPEKPITSPPTTCPVCGAVLQPGMAFCAQCGASVPTGMATPPPPAQSAPAGRICPKCGAPVTSGSAFCEACGAALPGAGPQFPQPAPQISPPPPPPPAPVSPPVQGRFVVRGSNAPLPFPPGKSEILIGRSDPGSRSYPDIDLNPYGGARAGVSRRHARIFLRGNQLYIEDLGSTNHTFVNQQRLVPHQPYPLNPGNNVRVGRVDLVFYL